MLGLKNGRSHPRATDQKSLKRVESTSLRWITFRAAEWISFRAAPPEWVLEEAERAKEQHKLIPVCLEGTKPPFGFSALQALDLSNWNGDPSSPTFERLLLDMDRLLGPSVRREYQPPPLSGQTADRSNQDPGSRPSDGIKATSKGSSWPVDALAGFAGLGGLTLVGLMITPILTGETRELFSERDFGWIPFAVATSGMAGALAGVAAKRHRVAVVVAIASVVVGWLVGLLVDPRYEGTQVGLLGGGLIGALGAYVTRRL